VVVKTCTLLHKQKKKTMRRRRRRRKKTKKIGFQIPSRYGHIWQTNAGIVDSISTLILELVVVKPCENVVENKSFEEEEEGLVELGSEWDLLDSQDR
jgi:hypothetical protein